MGDDNVYAPSLREIAAYGLDETGMLERYMDQIEAAVAEQGLGLSEITVKQD